MSVHICAPPVERIWIKRSYCPTCKKRRFFLCEVYEWYGIYETCLRCGERWAEGEMLERPFCRGWRKESVDRAKKLYQKLKEKKA